jgi:DegV family protein with EDD domain
MKFSVVVDSTFYLSEEEIKRYGIKRASLNVIQGEHTYKELELENQFIYDRLKNGQHLTTSQPSPAEFLTLYEEALAEGADVVFVMTLAQPLSGTYQSAELARKMSDAPEKIHLFQSRMAAMGNEMLCLELCKMIEAGHTKEEIVDRIERLNATSHTNFTIENLIHLMRSGRLSKAKAMIGTVLRVKPILEQDETGKLGIHGSARTHKKVMEMILENIRQTTKGASKIIVRFISKNSHENARELERLVKETFDNVQSTFSEYIGPVFSLHLGTNAYGLAWCSE